MSVLLHHHPFTRAATVVSMLEEVGCDYTLSFVDIRSGEQKTPDLLELNPMGKLPILVDGDVVVTESAAIGLYLADRYAPGRLAPLLDEPERGAYLRWAFFAPSVIEPGALAKGAGWDFKPGSAGWGTYTAMLDTIEAAIGEGPWLLGDRFCMTDLVFGGTLRWMLQFGMVEARPSFTAYAERLGSRPAVRRAEEINARVIEERGLRTS